MENLERLRDEAATNVEESAHRPQPRMDVEDPEEELREVEGPSCRVAARTSSEARSRREPGKEGPGVFGAFGFGPVSTGRSRHRFRHDTHTHRCCRFHIVAPGVVARFERDWSGRSCSSRLRLRASSVSQVGSTVPASSQAQRGGLAVVDMSRDDSDRESQLQMSSRFAVLSDDADELERPSQIARGRRLVLVSQNHDAVASDHEWDLDTESIRGASDVEEDDVPAQSTIETLFVADRIQARARAFASLDSVNLLEFFSHRPRLMQTVPWVMRGAFRSAVQEASETDDELKATRGWKLLGVAKDDLVQTFSRRHDPSKEVGGKDSVVPTRVVIGVASRKRHMCRVGPHTSSPQKASPRQR